MANNTSITEYVQQDSVKNQINSVLKSRASQFVTSVISLVNTNVAYADVDKKSLLNACLIAASLDLPVNQNLGYAYIIPFNDKNSGLKLAQLQIGYKGFIQLAQRSNKLLLINVTDVREGEFKGLNRRTGQGDFEWMAEGPDRDSKKIVGYLAYFQLKNNFEKELYMTSEDLKKHGGKFSQTFKKGYGLWRDEFDAMAKKTVIKLLLSKYAPLSTEMARAQQADQAVIVDEGEYEYPDNEKQTVDEIGEGKHRARLLRCIEQAKTIEELGECQGAVHEYNDEEISDKYNIRSAELAGESGAVS